VTPPWIEGPSWLDAVSGAFAAVTGNLPFGDSPWSDRSTRARLVTRARWGLLAVLGLYGLFAGGLFTFSDYGFFLDRPQLAFLAGSVGCVALYNLVIHAGWLRAQEHRFVDHAQILLDLFFITVLVHLSGGVASWFWPAYLIVTIEAGFLLRRQREVWAVGAAGAAMYGLMLAGNHFGIWPPVAVPFSSVAQSDHVFHLALAWSWVAILNSAVAVITAYLMSVIRWDHRALRKREAQLQQFVDSANDLIICLTPEGRFLYVNPLWMRLTGYDLPGLEHTTFFDLIDLEHRARVLKEFGQALLETRSTSIEAEFVARNGRRISVEGHLAPTLQEGRPHMAWCICRDVTVRKHAEEQLFRMAHFDALTGLPNRSNLMARVEEARTGARASGRLLALLFVDLDRFKLINDSLGHAVGDDLLQAVARRFQRAIQDSDTVCRIGADEFIVALTDVPDPKEVPNLVGRLLKPLGRPFHIGSHEIFITASVGISVFPEDGDDLDLLVKRANIAMSHAKSLGRNNHQFYHPKMDEDADRRLALSHGLRLAMEAGEFRVHYQPKVDVVTGLVTALEALVRWEHPELGLLPPTEFVPLAEEAGLILPMGEWVLREACRQAVAWQREGLPPTRIGVNLSGYQLQMPGMALAVWRILEETGLAPEWLELEITETVVMQNPSMAVTVLEEIRALGVQVSIDDFGTGYSSLSQLQRFSVNTLKIDKSFIRDLEHNPTDAAIVTAIIAMGLSLNLEVVAEGVETEGQLAFLREKQCHGAQGFYFSGPVPPREASGMILAGYPPVPVRRRGPADS